MFSCNLTAPGFQTHRREEQSGAIVTQQLSLHHCLKCFLPILLLLGTHLLCQGQARGSQQHPQEQGAPAELLHSVLGTLAQVRISQKGELFDARGIVHHLYHFLVLMYYFSTTLSIFSSLGKQHSPS